MYFICFIHSFLGTNSLDCADVPLNTKQTNKQTNKHIAMFSKMETLTCLEIISLCVNHWLLDVRGAYFILASRCTTLIWLSYLKVLFKRVHIWSELFLYIEEQLFGVRQANFKTLKINGYPADYWNIQLLFNCCCLCLHGSTLFFVIAGKYYLSFEFSAYDLNSLLHGFNMKLLPEHVSCIFRQLLRALVYCHQRSIVHCDVRPCNILISAKYATFSVFLIAIW